MAHRAAPPPRFDEVAELLERAGLRVSRRSQWHSAPATPAEADVWLGDSLGEMALVLRPGRRRLARGQFRPAGWPEPDRGGRLRVPGGTGAPYLQLCASRGRRMRRRGSAARGRHGAGRARGLRMGRQPPAPGVGPQRRPCSSHRRTGVPPSAPHTRWPMCLPPPERGSRVVRCALAPMIGSRSATTVG